MCGRYACGIKNLGRWGPIFKIWLEEFREDFNIAPGAMVPVFMDGGWKLMQWGLVPSWSKEPKNKYATFNARSETLAEKPAFRGAWKQEKRCLVPMSGYYEWKKVGSGKIPYFIRPIDDEPLVLAGLWEEWSDETHALLSFTIITTAARGGIGAIHHRTPLILQPGQAGEWLMGDVKSAEIIMRLPIGQNLKYYRIDSRVGNSRVKDENLISPIGDETLIVSAVSL